MTMPSTRVFAAGVSLTMVPAIAAGGALFGANGAWLVALLLVPSAILLTLRASAPPMLATELMPVARRTAFPHPADATCLMSSTERF